jgi:16S rRNA C1402 (ribose-2'-O) methylase RsmI
LDILGNRIVAFGRELTKAHEELTVKTVAGHLDALGEPRGEYTLVVAPEEQARAADSPAPDATQLMSEFGELTKSGAASRREALKALAARHGISSRTLYRILEDAKTSGD